MTERNKFEDLEHNLKTLRLFIKGGQLVEALECLDGFKEELQQLFLNRPRWIVKSNSKAVDILSALAELQRWCDILEDEILGKIQRGKQRGR